MSEPDSSRIQLDPDTPEIVGVEDYGTAYVAHVCVDDVLAPVRVRELPSKTASIREVTVTVDGQQLLPRDPRRRRAWITATAVFRIGTTQAGALNSVVPLPVGPTLPPFGYSSMDELWAAAVVAPVTVQVITEQWAE